MAWIQPAALTLVGVLAGLIGGVLGVGGGIVLVPVLHLAYGLPMGVAVGTSLVVITGTSIASTAGYLRRDLVLRDLGLELELGTLAGALIAALGAAYLPESVVVRIFVGALVWTSGLLWWRGRDRAGFLVPAVGWRRGFAWLLTPAAGAASGLLGVGGGLVQVPILRLLLGLEMRLAVATSALTVGMTASVAAMAYLARSQVELDVVPWLLGGILLGGWMAPAVGQRLGRRVLEIAFALLLLYGAYRMAAP